MPAIPEPWKRRGYDPYAWQFDGDHGLYLPGGGIDVDVNIADRARMLRMAAPVREPGLVLGNDGPPHDPYYVDRAEVENDDESKK